MLKRIGEKAVPVIIATVLLVAVIIASAFAIRMMTKYDTTATEKVAVNTYIDKETGVKLESDSIVFSDKNTYIYNSTADVRIYYGYEFSIKKCIDIHIGVVGDIFRSIDFSENPVTAYIPCKTEGCYVILLDNETGEHTQIEAEYIDDYYKVKMTTSGSYYICDEPLEEGEGELVEQTLIHDKTGVSATGMLRTNSKLKAYNANELFADLLVLDDGSTIVPLEREHFDDYTKMTTYEVMLFRNLEQIQAEGELAITLPNKYEDCEVRVITNSFDLADRFDIPDSLNEYLMGIQSELMEPTISDQEIADRINIFFEQAYPVIESEYVDGGYLINTDKLGVFFVVPKGSFALTAEDVAILKTGTRPVAADDPDP